MFRVDHCLSRGSHPDFASYEKQIERDIASTGDMITVIGL